MKRSDATIFLIPSPISTEDKASIPEDVATVLLRCNVFVCERIRTTRRWIRQLYDQETFDRLIWIEMDKHNVNHYLDEVTPYLGVANSIAVVSEAGMPAIADPGASLVSLAHRLGAEVVPIAGPCSFIMALAASGLNGQNFTFHGYLERDRQRREKQLHQMGQLVQRTGYSQLFMETPYRNTQLLQEILATLSSDHLLHVSIGLDDGDAQSLTLPLREWKKREDLFNEKRPAVFILGRWSKS